MRQCINISSAITRLCITVQRPCMDLFHNRKYTPNDVAISSRDMVYRNVYSPPPAGVRVGPLVGRARSAFTPACSRNVVDGWRAFPGFNVAPRQRLDLGPKDNHSPAPAGSSSAGRLRRAPDLDVIKTVAACRLMSWKHCRLYLEPVEYNSARLPRR